MTRKKVKRDICHKAKGKDKRHVDDGGMFFAKCAKCGKVLDDYQPGSML